ncbi:MAG: polymerase sporulation-specific sigma factor, partial [Clostridiales bacterium]|nr:polymerase sporulation-specific sigma factor [Clostridiales bacterium]
MDKYVSDRDEEIIQKIRNHDTEAMDYILEKYKNLVRKKARKLFLIGGDRDDLIQEGMIGLYKAVRDYDPSKETSFSVFADLCISRQLYDAI